MISFTIFYFQKSSIFSQYTIIVQRYRIHNNLIFFYRYFCRSVEYDEQIRRCIIFEEDSMSQKDDLRVSSSPTHDLYDLVCLDNRKC